MHINTIKADGFAFIAMMEVAPHTWINTITSVELDADPKFLDLEILINGPCKASCKSPETILTLISRTILPDLVRRIYNHSC